MMNSGSSRPNTDDNLSLPEEPTPTRRGVSFDPGPVEMEKFARVHSPPTTSPTKTPKRISSNNRMNSGEALKLRAALSGGGAGNNPPSTTQDNDNTLDDGSEASSRASHESSVMTDGSNATASGAKDLRAITNAKIPFHVQVLLLMAVPMAFLFGVLIAAVVVAGVSKAYINEHRPLVLQAFACTNAMMIERGEMSQFVSYPPGSQGAAFERNLLDNKLRPNTNALCERVRRLAGDSSDSAVSGFYRDDVVLVLKEWEQLRTLSDLRFMDGIVRERKAEAVDRINNIISVIAQNKNAIYTARSLMQLKFARYMANYIGAMRASGAFVISLRENVTFSQVIAFGRLRFTFESNLDHFRSEMNSVGNTWLREMLDHPLTKTTLDYIARVSSGNFSSYAHIAQPQYFNQFTDMLRIMNTFAISKGGMLDDATAGKRETNEIVKSVLVMFFALLCSLLAAAFLVYRQQQSVKQLKATIQYSSDMNGAVRRYVPKRFLRLMGSTSVMEVTAGEKTEVAVTMLFSDIRDFTHISSQMTNEFLFDWLQNYLSAMTQVTEDFSGFIDKFVGDAIFSVFQSCDKAVHCAVNMNLTADQLNLEMVSKNQSQLLQIGVGIHHGVVSAGILGDESRHTATLVASDVNMASRLEGLTKYFGARILISKAVAERCALRQFAQRRIGKVRVKGGIDPIEIFEVFQPDGLALKMFKEETKNEFEMIVADLERNGDLKVAQEALRAMHQKQDDRRIQPYDKALLYMAEKIDKGGNIVFREK